MSGPPINSIVVGDATQVLTGWPECCIDCAVTSPPYLLLRNYGVAGQMGLENSVDAYVDRLVSVCDEIARVMTPTGSLWLNLGDSFSRSRRFGAPPKSLLLVPERVLLALSDHGWVVRAKTVWSKPNPMPSSVKDRLSCTWEPIYHLVREQTYFFDLDAVRVPHKSRPRGLHSSRRPAMRGSRGNKTKYGNGRPSFVGPLAGSNDGLARARAEGRPGHPLGKNPGDVWSIATAGFRGDHPAPFPPRLIERPIRATCPERVCVRCTRPWQRNDGQLQPSCRCDAGWRAGVVLDPFMGSGTTALVAEALGRTWVGVDINARYAQAAMTRITSDLERVRAHLQQPGGDARSPQ